MRSENSKTNVRFLPLILRVLRTLGSALLVGYIFGAVAGLSDRDTSKALESPPETPVVRQAQSTQSLSPAHSDQSKIVASTESLTSKTALLVTTAAGKLQEQQTLKGESSRTSVISIPKPRMRPTQLSQSPIQRTEQGVFTSPASSDQAAFSVVTESPATQTKGPVNILPQQPLEQQKTEGQSSRGAALPTGCEFLRQAFHRGALVQSVDPAVYKLLLKCQRLKIDQRHGEPPLRVAAEPASQGANQQTADGSATSGGNSGSDGNNGSGGSGSGGKSNGHGNSKGN
jgi:hypothetical protein